MTISLSALGQSITVDKSELTQMVRTCEKCTADLEDYKSIISEGKVIVQAMEVRLAEKQQVIADLNDAINKLKVAYKDLEESKNKGKFWVWLKGVGVGVVTGAAIIISISL